MKTSLEGIMMKKKIAALSILFYMFTPVSGFYAAKEEVWFSHCKLLSFPIQ
jgi:hypothetical protein